MSVVYLNEASYVALDRLQQHRRRMHTLKGREADDAREQVRSYAVEFVNEVLRGNVHLVVPDADIDALLRGEL